MGRALPEHRVGAAARKIGSTERAFWGCSQATPGKATQAVPVKLRRCYSDVFSICRRNIHFLRDRIANVVRVVDASR
jgi:hypothetical protein